MKSLILAFTLSLFTLQSFAAPISVSALLKQGNRTAHKGHGLGRMAPLSAAQIGKVSHLKGSTFALGMKLNIPVKAHAYMSAKVAQGKTHLLITLVTTTNPKSIDHTMVMSEFGIALFETLVSYGGKAKGLHQGTVEKNLAAGILRIDTFEVPESMLAQMDIGWMDDFADRISSLRLY